MIHGIKKRCFCGCRPATKRMDVISYLIRPRKHNCFLKKKWFGDLLYPVRGAAPQLAYVDSRAGQKEVTSGKLCHTAAVGARPGAGFSGRQEICLIWPLPVKVISACSCRTATGAYPDGSSAWTMRRLVSPPGYACFHHPAG